MVNMLDQFVNQGVVSIQSKWIWWVLLTEDMVIYISGK